MTDSVISYSVISDSTPSYMKFRSINFLFLRYIKIPSQIYGYIWFRYTRISYIYFHFWVIPNSVIWNSVIADSVISHSYSVISNSFYQIPLYQSPLYQIHCGLLIRFPFHPSSPSCPLPSPLGVVGEKMARDDKDWKITTRPTTRIVLLSPVHRSDPR